MRCPHCGAARPDDARFCGACGRASTGTEPSYKDLTGAIPAQAPDLVGREVAGRYRVLAKLGEGGMGAVYRGEQLSLKRKVAIKVLRPELSRDPGLVRRFNAEAELAARLSHPNTVNIYDFGQDADGALFIAMEFLEGRSLRDVMTHEGPLPPARAVVVAQQIAASLADAHAHGIVHRDLKPDNVMLTERGKDRDVVRVLDFGIAKLRDDDRQTVNAMTRAGDLIGTPQYMAPEQIRGEQVDGRTDVYALGAMLYEMVTGRLPFEGPTVMAILSRHLTDAPEPPMARRPDLGLPPALDHLIMAALAKDPAHRQPTMERLGEDLAALAVQLGAARSAAMPASVPLSGADSRRAMSRAAVRAPRTPPSAADHRRRPRRDRQRRPWAAATPPPPVAIPALAGSRRAAELSAGRAAAAAAAASRPRRHAPPRRARPRRTHRRGARAGPAGYAPPPGRGPAGADARRVRRACRRPRRRGRRSSSRCWWCWPPPAGGRVLPPRSRRRRRPVIASRIRGRPAGAGADDHACDDDDDEPDEPDEAADAAAAVRRRVGPRTAIRPWAGACACRPACRPRPSSTPAPTIAIADRRHAARGHDQRRRLRGAQPGQQPVDRRARPVRQPARDEPGGAGDRGRARRDPRRRNRYRVVMDASGERAEARLIHRAARDPDGLATPATATGTARRRAARVLRRA
ncbi:MAG: protein kinase [Kofleriaceae bacterium]|nr:protein kinase [Kofleriaceae bacterium]